jgi:hypothetical protein
MPRDSAMVNSSAHATIDWPLSAGLSRSSSESQSGADASGRHDRRAGTLDSLPHNGAVVTLPAVCGAIHRQSYLDIVMVGIVARSSRSWP